MVEVCPWLALYDSLPCAGMSYIAAVFLLVMDTYHAFQCLCNVVNSHLYTSAAAVATLHTCCYTRCLTLFAGTATTSLCHSYFDVFRLDAPRMTKHLLVYEALFAQHMPTLYEHLKELEVTTQMYLLDWYGTNPCGRC